MKIYLSLIFACAICFIGTSQTVVACDCRGNTVNERVDKSTLVFSGKVTGFEWRKDIVVKIAEDNTKRDGGIYEVLTANFDVDKWWKGEPSKKISLIEGPIRFSKGYSLRNSCDFHFVVGETYLIYAFGKEDKYSTDDCMGTRILTAAAEDLKFLGDGHDPIEENEKIKPQ